MPCQSEEGQCFQKNFAHTICDLPADDLNPKIKYFSSHKQIVQILRCTLPTMWPSSAIKICLNSLDLKLVGKNNEGQPKNWWKIHYSLV